MGASLVLLSGPIAVGKTAVSEILVGTFGFRKISSGDYLRETAQRNGLVVTRENLQELGDRLDLETEFTWLVNEVAAPMIAGNPTQSAWYVDAVRKKKQVEAFKLEFSSARHVHLTAPESVLLDRYMARQKPEDGGSAQVEYVIATEHPNEISARSLVQIADLVIDMSLSSPEEAASLIIAMLGGIDA